MVSGQRACKSLFNDDTFPGMFLPIVGRHAIDAADFTLNSEHRSVSDVTLTVSGRSNEAVEVNFAAPKNQFGLFMKHGAPDCSAAP